MAMILESEVPLLPPSGHFTKEELDSMPVPAGKIVFLGSNPSCSSPYDDPFSHCKSANKMLNEWIPALGLTRDQVHFMNVANYKTANNRPLRQKEVNLEIPRLIFLLKNQVVVSLGKTAEWVSSYIYYRCGRDDRPTVIHMPHPSGRNRVLNDKEMVKQMLIDNRAAISDALQRLGRRS